MPRLLLLFALGADAYNTLSPPATLSADSAPQIMSLDDAIAAQGNGTVDKVVFLHVQTTGGTAFVQWMAKVHAMCAHGQTKEAVDALGDSPSLFGYLARDDFGGMSFEKFGKAQKVSKDTDLSKCGPARKLCHISVKESWPEDTDCPNQVKRAIDSGCTFVELHHYDVSVLDAFAAHGYKTFTILRNPTARLQSVVTKLAETPKMIEKAKTKEAGWMKSQLAERILVPDLGATYLSGCSDTSRLSNDPQNQAHYSCVMEFQKSKDPTLRSIGERVSSQVAAHNATCFVKAGWTDKKTGAEYARQSSPPDAYQRIYALAQARLQRMDLVGTLEKLDSLLPVFAAKFNIGLDRLPGPVKHQMLACVPNCDKAPKPAKHQEGTMLDATKVGAFLDKDTLLWSEADRMFTETSSALLGATGSEAGSAVPS